VIDYDIYYDQATGVYDDLEAGITTLSYTTTVLLTPGAVYNFKVEARNQVGYSLHSAPLAVLCA